MSLLRLLHPGSLLDSGVGGERPRLSTAIFSNFVLFVLGMILVVALALAAIFYWSFEVDTERSLLARAESLAERLDAMSDEERVGLLSSQVLGGMRITLIDEDGSVLFDNAADKAFMENHGQRPEVIGAGENGKATIARVSATLGEDVVYAAVLLADGDIVRISQLRETLPALLADVSVPLAFALCAVVLLTMLFSQKLARDIVRPLDGVNWSGDCIDALVYEEMAPMAARISEQHRQLELQNGRLAEVSAMRRDFSANVSHEMKTPLHVISGYAELMKSGLVDDADIERFSGLIYDEAQSMRALIDDVLTLSLLDERAMEPSAGVRSWVVVDLLQVAKRVQARLEPFARDNGVAVSVRGDSALVRAHETLLEQAVFNLVENGIRYNDAGGSVAVTVFADEYEDDSLMRQCTTVDLLLGEHVRREAVVRVEDTGWGIPEDQRDRVFERFYRLEQSRSKETGGTGLGLAIVKHVVEYHGGHMSLDGAVGKGSSFELRFPTDC